MECRKCEIWKRHKDSKNQRLTKGTCKNPQFRGPRKTYTTTTEHTRCSTGVKKVR